MTAAMRSASPVPGGRDRRGARAGLRALVVAALLLPLAACATKRDIRDLRAEIRSLSARQDSAFAALAELNRANRDSLRAQGQTLFELRGDLNRRLLDIQDQLIAVQELTGQSQRNVASLRDQLEAQRRSVFEPSTAADPEAGEAGEAGSAEEMYNAGVTNFNRGSLSTAQRAFQQFLRAYPNHRLAPDAQYYVADIMVQENRLDEAIQAFLRIPEIHPTAERVPEAYYRVGLLYLETGRQDEARSYLERVVNTYPDSDAAELARERLREIR